MLRRLVLLVTARVGEPVGGAAEGNALLLHRHVAADGEGDQLEQAQEDADLAVEVDFRRRFAEGRHSGRADDVDQQDDHGDAAEDGRDHAEGDRKRSEPLREERQLRCREKAAQETG